MDNLKDIEAIIALQKMTDAKLRLSGNYDVIKLLDTATSREIKEHSTVYFFDSFAWNLAVEEGTTGLYEFLATLRRLDYAFIRLGSGGIDDLEARGDPYGYGLEVSHSIVNVDTYDPPITDQPLKE